MTCTIISGSPRLNQTTGQIEGLAYISEGEYAGHYLRYPDRESAEQAIQAMRESPGYMSAIAKAEGEKAEWWADYELYTESLQ